MFFLSYAENLTENLPSEMKHKVIFLPLSVLALKIKGSWVDKGRVCYVVTKH
jgi:hypothetical protein